MAKTNNTESPTVNLIATGTTLQGEIESKGDMRIDGTLEGTIKSSGKVVIGTTGKVKGEIYCQNADISGQVDAKVNVRELLSLKASSSFAGEIKTDKLAIEPGARFSGTCNMEETGNKQAPSASNKDERSGKKEKVT
ncbi:MAG: polymer-forming cytoskeletal protein [Bacteroidales bacterium]|nr:polymer-forming cytoskeletal protein [Bacteroidales bacterium]